MEKIKELTDKLYHEGVEKGQAEADRIIEAAKAQAQQIIDEANERAAAIGAKAQKDAAELDKNTKNELRLYTNQALNALKSEVANVMTDKVVATAVDDLIEDKSFLGQFTVALAQQWAKDEPVVIEANDAQQLKAYFAAHAKALLNKGVTIKKVSHADTLFTIAPEDGSYRVRFGKEEFEQYFKAFLRPELVDMLF